MFRINEEVFLVGDYIRQFFQGEYYIKFFLVYN